MRGRRSSFSPIGALAERRPGAMGCLLGMFTRWGWDTGGCRGSWGHLGVGVATHAAGLGVVVGGGRVDGRSRSDRPLSQEGGHIWERWLCPHPSWLGTLTVLVPRKLLGTLEPGEEWPFAFKGHGHGVG